MVPNSLKTLLDPNIFSLSHIKSSIFYFSIETMMFKEWYKTECEKLSSRLKILEPLFNCQTDGAGRIAVLFKELNMNTEYIKERYEKKSREHSLTYRSAGNKLFVAKKLRSAILAYNRSIKYAPSGSKEQAMGFANRSAILFEWEAYTLAINDINLAFKGDYPANLHYKLWERLGKCYSKLHNYVEAIKAFKMGITTLQDNADLAIKQRSERTSLLSQWIKNCEEPDDVKENVIEVENKVYTVTAPKISDVNQIFPCAGKSFSIVDEPGKGRHAIATEDIRAGDVIIVEKPYTSICLQSSFETHCYGCLNRYVVSYPCQNCASVSYCSEECEQRNWLDFHQYECRYMNILIQDDVGLGHLALKMIVLTGLEKLGTIEERLKKLSDVPQDLYGVNENGCFDSTDYYCVYSLVGNSSSRSPSDLFRRSLLALFMTKMLSASDFFKDVENKDKSICLIATHLLKQIQMLPCNAHEVSEQRLAGIDYANAKLTEVGSAVYTTLSLLNHSCDPSVVRHCYDDTCVLRAIKYIKKGDPIVDNYGFIYAVEEKVSRQKHIYEQYYFTCACHACINDWPLYDALPTTPLDFQCRHCNSILSKDLGKCEQCNYIDIDVANFASTQEKFHECMESVLDSGEIKVNLHILRFLNVISRHGVLPNIQLNNCQEVAKLLFSLQGNFVQL